MGFTRLIVIMGKLYAFYQIDCYNIINKIDCYKGHYYITSNILSERNLNRSHYKYLIFAILLKSSALRKYF